jgi:hypothetical protein
VVDVVVLDSMIGPPVPLASGRFIDPVRMALLL